MKILSLAVLTGVTAMLGVSPLHADEYESLFDGKTLKGAKGDLKFWTVEDGVIAGATAAENPTNGTPFLSWKTVKWRTLTCNSSIASSWPTRRNLPAIRESSTDRSGNQFKKRKTKQTTQQHTL